jgi:large conductance mechanosensitive channel
LAIGGSVAPISVSLAHSRWSATMKMWDEFKAFAFKGNMIDLAIAVVIGTAFTAVINSLVKNVIMPVISYISPGDTSYTHWHIGRIEFGTFLGEAINFLIIAVTVFFLFVKIVGSIVKRPAPEGPPMKECPMCCSNIPAKARKCAHCTADLAAT